VKVLPTGSLSEIWLVVFMFSAVPAGIVAALMDETAAQVQIAAIPAMNFEYFISYEHEPDPGCQEDG